MPVLRRRPSAPSQPVSADPAPIPEEVPVTPRPGPRRRIPIRGIDSPVETENRHVLPNQDEAPLTDAQLRQRAKAYVPTPEEVALRAQHTNYEKIVRRYEAKVRNPRTAIRARCIQCCSGQMKEVQLCPCTTCALHPFRMGENPFNKRTAARIARDEAIARGETPPEVEEDDEQEDE